MTKSKISKFSKGAVWTIAIMFLAMSCMFLLSACGSKETPMELSGKTVTVDWTKTEFDWKAETTDEEKTGIEDSMKENEVVTLVFNVDGSTTGFGDFFGAEVLYYTQDGSSLKVYIDEEKTTEAVATNGGSIVFDVKTDSLRLKIVMPEDTDQSFTAYTMVFAVKVA